MSILYQNRPERFHFFTSDNNTTGAHLHRQVELLIVLEGFITATINHTNYTLEPLSGIIVFPNQVHSLHTAKSSRILLCIFDGDFCHSYQKYFQNAVPENPVFSLNKQSHHSRTALDGLLMLTADFSREGTIPKDILLLSEGYLTLLLASFFPKLKWSSQGVSHDIELEQKLLLYLDAHYQENLSLELLSREFGISRFRLSRIFSDSLHTTFPDYVNSKRLEYASDLLRSTSLSVTQIALDSGFGSSRTFFREFQRSFHMTPKEYRQG